MLVSRLLFIIILVIMASYLLCMPNQPADQSNVSFKNILITYLGNILITFFDILTTHWLFLGSSTMLCIVGIILIYAFYSKENKVLEQSLARRSLHKSLSDAEVKETKYSVKKCPLHWIFKKIIPCAALRKLCLAYPVIENGMGCPANRLASFRTLQHRNEQWVTTLVQDGFYFDETGGVIRCIGCEAHTDVQSFRRGVVPPHFGNCRRPTNNDDLTQWERLFGNRSRDIDSSSEAALSQNAVAQCPQVGILWKNSPYSSLAERENSFRGLRWAVDKNSPQRLASQGLFYTGTADKVECCKCGFSLIGWVNTPGLSLQEKHHNANWKCPFIKCPTTAAASASP